MSEPSFQNVKEEGPVREGQADSWSSGGTTFAVQWSEADAAVLRPEWRCCALPPVGGAEERISYLSISLLKGMWS